MLVNELKKIEARKKERERKTQDLQKLISQADQVIQNRKTTENPSQIQSKNFIYSKETQHQIRPAIESRTKN